jgi:hypothetical protein
MISLTEGMEENDKTNEPFNSLNTKGLFNWISTNFNFVKWQEKTTITNAYKLI